MPFNKETSPEKRETHPIERYPKQDNSAAKKAAGEKLGKLATQHTVKNKPKK